MATSEKAMKAMEIGDAKKIVAVTTDNPTVMQSFRRKFQTKYYWVLVSVEILLQATKLT
jgi:hypothetical protein